MADSTADERAESVKRQLADSKPGNAGQTSAPADEQPATDATDEAPDSPKGVGDSPSRSGEDMKDADGNEAGREDVESDSPTGRPAGTSTARDRSGVADDKGNTD